MRSRRLAFAWVTVAFALAPAVLVGAPAYAASASLTLSSDHGEPEDDVTAVYQFLPDSDRCSRFTVQFFWDSRPVERRRISSRTCSVEVRLTPPRSARQPGQHQITAIGPRAGSQAAQFYTIGDVATPSVSDTPVNPTLPEAAPPANAPLPTRSPDLAGGRPAWVWPGLIIGILLVLGGAGFLILMVLRMHSDDEAGGLHRGPGD